MFTLLNPLQMRWFTWRSILWNSHTGQNRWWNRRALYWLQRAHTYDSITDIDIMFGWIFFPENYVLNLNFALVLGKKYIQGCKMTIQNINFLSSPVPQWLNGHVYWYLWSMNCVIRERKILFGEQICIKHQCEQDFIEVWCWLHDQL